MLPLWAEPILKFLRQWGVVIAALLTAFFVGRSRGVRHVERIEAEEDLSEERRRADFYRDIQDANEAVAADAPTDRTELIERLRDRPL